MRTPVTLPFTDRKSQHVDIEGVEGESIDQCLRRHHIPPNSVLVRANGAPVPDDHVIDAANAYEIELIEGYDIEEIRTLYQSSTEPSNGVYRKRRFMPAVGGNIEKTDEHLTLPEVEADIERRVAETIAAHDLIADGETVLVGFSGGVDSSGLVYSLAAARDRLDRDFDLVAVTFREIEAEDDPAIEQTATVTDTLDVDHQFATPVAEEIFGVDRPFDEILPALMETDDSDHVMYIEHHIMRRTLEAYANEIGADTISLGLHTTDLLAGLLNFFATGHRMAPIGRREIGDVAYVYPLQYVLKKELHLYYRQKTGSYATHSAPSVWELNPLDRNFYYYLADMLQSYWPGIEYWFFEGHNARVSDTDLEYGECPNCGGTTLAQAEMAPSDPCGACRVLERYGYLE